MAAAAACACDAAKLSIAHAGMQSLTALTFLHTGNTLWALAERLRMLLHTCQMQVFMHAHDICRASALPGAPSETHLEERRRPEQLVRPCMQEVLRMYPPVAFGQMRVSFQHDLVLAGRLTIPRGTLLWVPHHSLHNASFNWDRPHTFLPGGPPPCPGPRQEVPDRHPSLPGSGAPLRCMHAAWNSASANQWLCSPGC